MDEGRELVYKGELNKRDGEIQVHLFDHALLFTKLVKTKHVEQYKVYRRVSLSYLSLSRIYRLFMLLLANTVGIAINHRTSGRIQREWDRPFATKTTSFGAKVIFQ